MESETRVYNQLFLLSGYRELEKKLLGGDVVYVGESQADKSLRELIGNGLGRQMSISDFAPSHISTARQDRNIP